MEGALGRVDRNVREVGTAETFELGIEVGEVTSLKQRIVGKIDAGHNVLRAERDLFGLGKEIVHTAIEDEPADAADGDILLRDDLGGIEHIEVESLGKVLIEELQTQFPFREVAHLG
jgi:hypothetical protein